MIVTLLWIFLIFLLSVIPTRDLHTGHPTDKVIHFVIYGITAIIFLRHLRAKASIIKSVILSVIFTSAYGFLIEIIQSVLPWREFSLADIVSNLTGAVFFSILYILGHHYWKKF